MIMDSEHHIDVEALEQICFERSKKWSNLFEKISSRDDGQELFLNEFDAIFEKCNEDDDDAGSDLEFVVIDEVMEEKPNYNKDPDKTRVEGNEKPKEKYDLPLPLVKVDDGHNDEDHDKIEMENLVDETLPFLVEHKRKWEENGLERVLQSFDAERIERKVGSWLRRNNSIFSQNNKTVCYNTPPDNHHGKQVMTQHCKYKHHHKKKDEDRRPTYSSDEESMHSVDTARYIKSIRRHVEPQSNFSSFCTKTTIKTYRMVKSKRDELREKYGCPEYDEEHSHRIQKMRHRRSLNHRQHDYGVALCQRKYPLDIGGHHMSSAQRRKHLIKRRSHFDTSVSSSSSNDDECEECMVVCNCTSRPMIKSTPRCASVQRTKYRCDQTHRHLDKTSSSCGCSSKHNGRQCEQRDLFFEDDRRPYRRETECDCCNDTKLCKNVRHLANSSTEDWLVENGDSGDKIKMSSKLDHSKALKEKEKLNSKDKKRAIDGCGSGNRHVTFNAETNQSAINKKTSSRDYAKTSRSLRERNSIKNYALDSSSSHSSNDSYRPVKKKNYSLDSSSGSDDSFTSVKKKKKKSIMKRTNAEIKTKKSRPPTSPTPPPASESKKKSAKKQQQQPSSLNKSKEKHMMKHHDNKVSMQRKPTNDENDAIGDTFKVELEHAIKISKITYKEDMKRLAKDKKIKKSCIKPKKQKDDEMMEATLTNDGENTFFSSKHNICNSTALDSNDKKIELKHMTTKHEAAVSTTHHQVGGRGNNSSSSKNNSSSSSKNNNSSSSSKNNSCIKNNSSSSFGSNATSSKPKAAKRSLATMAHSITLKKIQDLDNDCTIVSSTTDADADPQQMQQNLIPTIPKTNEQLLLPSISDKGILLYAPHTRDVAPSNSFHNGYFTITEEHLSGIIGKEAAQKFLKYYIGRRHFEPRSTIYFKPPANNTTYRSSESSITLGGGDGGVDPTSHVSQYDDSDSDDDVFDKIGRYGQIYVSNEK